jgi:hypothetical protein
VVRVRHRSSLGCLTRLALLAPRSVQRIILTCGRNDTVNDGGLEYSWASPVGDWGRSAVAPEGP